jgi:hypothetical protein
MWMTEHSIETDVPLDAIWRAWAEVARWPEWNADIERIELIGPFETGSTIAMTPHGQAPVKLRLADVVEGERFVDEAQVAQTVIRTTHQIEPLDNGAARILYRLEASGPSADAIGPAISADFDDTLRALVEHAGR